MPGGGGGRAVTSRPARPDRALRPLSRLLGPGIRGGMYRAAVPYACAMAVLGDEGVLITGVYGSGKSSVAAEIAYLLEQRDQPYALLDLDYLGWVGDHATGHRLMLRNLAAVAPNYRDAGVEVFVVAYFLRDLTAL